MQISVLKLIFFINSSTSTSSSKSIDSITFIEELLSMYVNPNFETIYHHFITITTFDINSNTPTTNTFPSLTFAINFSDTATSVPITNSVTTNSFPSVSITTDTYATDAIINFFNIDTSPFVFNQFYYK